MEPAIPVLCRRTANFNAGETTSRQVARAVEVDRANVAVGYGHICSLNPEENLAAGAITGLAKPMCLKTLVR